MFKGSLVNGATMKHMATIIRFTIPSIVESVFPANIDKEQLVNAVQADLNAGSVLKASARHTRNEYKTVKDDEGNERQVIVMRSKVTGERLQCENTKPARFSAWCDCVRDVQQFGATEVKLPEIYAKWISEKFVKPANP